MNSANSGPSASPAFSLERHALQPRLRTVRLATREWLTDEYVRIRLEGAELQGFDSRGSDDHIRLFFPETPPDRPEDLRAAPSREYTPLAWDSAAGWLEIEFAIHGDAGVAAPWAATAPVGSIVGTGGPRGSLVLTGRPDAWLLAGDETAVPAMRRFAAQMDARATGRILVEVPDAEHELPLVAPDGVTVTQIHRGAQPAGHALTAELDRLTGADRPPGSVFGFVAAEQSIVRPGRALLLDRWGLDPATVIVKGYWKRGEAEYHAPH